MAMEGKFKRTIITTLSLGLSAGMALQPVAVFAEEADEVVAEASVETNTEAASSEAVASIEAADSIEAVQDAIDDAQAALDAAMELVDTTSEGGRYRQ